MIKQHLALVKREIWEHRSIWMTPAAVASIVTLGTLAALMFAGEYAQELDVALFGAQNLAGEAERKAVLTGLFFAPAGMFFIALGVLTAFYCLDALYAERKDKSILFWRSLPVTDAETVLSKLTTAIIVIPAAAIIGILATHLINLIVTSLWLSTKGGDAGLLVWSSVPLLDNWLSMIIIVFCSAIYMSPFVGWFLFVSAFAKRSPFMFAFLPLVLIPAIEGIFFHSKNFADVVWGRLGTLPLYSGGELEDLFDEDNFEVNGDMISVLSHLDIAQFITTASTWAGIIVCGLLCFGAIYVRRFRDES